MTSSDPERVTSPSKPPSQIAALVLAAGQSRRMGRPKMLLPWGGTTVLGKVIDTILRAGMADILVISGSENQQIESLALQLGVRSLFNPAYAQSDMLGSIQCGLRALASQSSAGQAPAPGALICLGDQPQIEATTVRLVRDTFLNTHANLVVPSYQMRRGHPWLVARPRWDDLLRMQPGRSPREFLNTYAGEIEYVTVNSRSVIEDLDTPEDYIRSRP